MEVCAHKVNQSSNRNCCVLTIYQVLDKTGYTLYTHVVPLICVAAGLQVMSCMHNYTRNYQSNWVPI